MDHLSPPSPTLSHSLPSDGSEFEFIEQDAWSTTGSDDLESMSVGASVFESESDAGVLSRINSQIQPGPWDAFGISHADLLARNEVVADQVAQTSASESEYEDADEADVEEIAGADSTINDIAVSGHLDPFLTVLSANADWTPPRPSKLSSVSSTSLLATEFTNPTLQFKLAFPDPIFSDHSSSSPPASARTAPIPQEDPFEPDNAPLDTLSMSSSLCSIFEPLDSIISIPATLSNLHLGDAAASTKYALTIRAFGCVPKDSATRSSIMRGIISLLGRSISGDGEPIKVYDSVDDGGCVYLLPMQGDVHDGYTSVLSVIDQSNYETDYPALSDESLPILALLFLSCHEPTTSIPQLPSATKFLPLITPSEPPMRSFLSPFDPPSSFSGLTLPSQDYYHPSRQLADLGIDKSCLILLEGGRAVPVAGLHVEQAQLEISGQMRDMNLLDKRLATLYEGKEAAVETAAVSAAMTQVHNECHVETCVEISPDDRPLVEIQGHDALRATTNPRSSVPHLIFPIILAFSLTFMAGIGAYLSRDGTVAACLSDSLFSKKSSPIIPVSMPSPVPTPLLPTTTQAFHETGVRPISHEITQLSLSTTTQLSVTATIATQDAVQVTSSHVLTIDASPSMLRLDGSPIPPLLDAPAPSATAGTAGDEKDELTSFETPFSIGNSVGHRIGTSLVKFIPMTFELTNSPNKSDVMDALDELLSSISWATTAVKDSKMRMKARHTKAKRNAKRLGRLGLRVAKRAGLVAWDQQNTGVSPADDQES